MPNPFDLTGPQFLVFYAVFAVLVIAVERFAVRWKETAVAAAQPAISDPYLIAYLRSGARAAIGVAALALIDRSMLEAADNGALTARQPPDLFSMPRIERALLALFQKRGVIQEAYADAEVQEACEAYRRTLEADGLLVVGAALARRTAAAYLAILILVAVAVAKIVIAIGRGHGNVMFLIMMSVFACIFAGAFTRERHTGPGKAMLADLEILFQRLRRDASAVQPQLHGSDLAFAAALYGNAALPPDLFPYASSILPAPPKPAKGSSWNNSGNGCGAVSGCGSSSCGSSCGGGCGGGCGGCGG